MSLVFVDSFDHYSERLDKWDNVTQAQGPAIDNAFGRFVDGSLRVSGGAKAGQLVKKLDVTTETEYICGFALYFADDTLADMRFNDINGNRCGEITFTGTTIQLKDKDDVVVASAPAVITAATWQFIEFRCKSHATLGELEAKVNNITVVSATNQDTRGSAIAEIAAVSHVTGNGTWYDDLYVLNTAGSAPQNTFLGDTRVTVLRPKANGVVNDFTPIALDNFNQVNEELHDGDASYVEAGQIGAHDDYTQYTFSDLGLAPGTIYGVQTVNAAKKTDAGALRYVDQMVIAGVRYDNGTEVTANSSLYKMSTFIRDTDPSDDAAWTEAKVDAVGSGFEITYREI